MTAKKKEEDTKSSEPQEEPEVKKQKMDYPCAPDNEWPEAWLMSASVEDQTKANKQEPNVAVSAADMRKLGISYWKMDADAFEYPVKAVPWVSRTDLLHPPMLESMHCDDIDCTLMSILWMALMRIFLSS